MLVTSYRVTATLIVHEPADATFESVARAAAGLKADDVAKAVTIAGRRIGAADVGALSLELISIESEGAGR